MPRLDHTHDPARRSWVESANVEGTDFPIQNLPHGVFVDQTGHRRGGIAIGDEVLDVGRALSAGLIPAEAQAAATAAAEPYLNRLLGMGRPAATGLRAALFDALAIDGAVADRAKSLKDELLIPMQQVTPVVPVEIGAFADFMTSVYHASAARAARPARELFPSYLHLPIGYNSRGSSVTADGADFRRPNVQYADADGSVHFGPTRELDFEVEFGAYVGRENELGVPIPIAEAAEHLFGFVLVNDWSARDVQRWESRLGPFLAKSFRTTVSAWIVTADAMEPFRVPPLERGAGMPKPLPYLEDEAHRREGALDVKMKAFLSTRKMRMDLESPYEIVNSQLLYNSWTLLQMLTHITSNGCNAQPGDLIGGGTVSGPTEETTACFFERTAGVLPIQLPNGESRLWIEDDDEVILTARAEREGFVGIGFGTCGAKVLPAQSQR
jgi:fumarylacetoacetase